MVVNLSDSGALVRSRRGYALGQTLTLVPIGPAGEILFDVPGTIMRIVENDTTAPGVVHYGLQFAELTPERESALRELCNAMPTTPEELKAGDSPEGGPPAAGGTPHHRIRTRVSGKSSSPRWSRLPFA